MARPLRVKYVSAGVSDGLIEMSDSDIADLIIPVVLTKVVSGDPGHYFNSALAINPANTDYTSVGSATDTINAAEGVHPASNTVVNTYTIKQENVANTVTSISPRPVCYEIVDGITKVREMTIAEIKTEIINPIVVNMANGGQGGYFLGPTSGGPPATGTWVSVSTMNDTYYVGSTLTTVEYTLWRRTTGLTPGTIRPVKQTLISGETRIVEMSDSDVIALADVVRDYIYNSGVGKYAFQPSSPVSGTWVSRGAFVDTINNLQDTGYVGAFAGSFTGDYVLTNVPTFTGTFQQTFTGIFGPGDYLVSYQAAPFSGQYSSVYSRLYSGAYTNVFGVGNYSRAYTSDFTNVYTLTYTGVYSRVFSPSFQNTFTLASYTLNFIGTYSNVFTRTFSGSYSAEFTRLFSGAYTNEFTRLFSGAYSGNTFSADIFTRAFTTIPYTGAFTQGYTNTFSGNFTGPYTGTFTSNAVSYSNIFSGANYTSAFSPTRFFSGSYANASENGYAANYSVIYTGPLFTSFPIGTGFFTSIFSRDFFTTGIYTGPYTREYTTTPAYTNSFSLLTPKTYTRPTYNVSYSQQLNYTSYTVLTYSSTVSSSENYSRFFIGSFSALSYTSQYIKGYTSNFTIAGYTRSYTTGDTVNETYTDSFIGVSYTGLARYSRSYGGPLIGFYTFDYTGLTTTTLFSKFFTGTFVLFGPPANYSGTFTGIATPVTYQSYKAYYTEGVAPKISYLQTYTSSFSVTYTGGFSKQQYSATQFFTGTSYVLFGPPAPNAASYERSISYAISYTQTYVDFFSSFYTGPLNLADYTVQYSRGSVYSSFVHAYTSFFSKTFTQTFTREYTISRSYSSVYTKIFSGSGTYNSALFYTASWSRELSYGGTYSLSFARTFGAWTRLFTRTPVTNYTGAPYFTTTKYYAGKTYTLSYSGLSITYTTTLNYARPGFPSYSGFASFGSGDYTGIFSSAYSSENMIASYTSSVQYFVNYASVISYTRLAPTNSYSGSTFVQTFGGTYTGLGYQTSFGGFSRIFSESYASGGTYTGLEAFTLTYTRTYSGIYIAIYTRNYTSGIDNVSPTTFSRIFTNSLAQTYTRNYSSYNVYTRSYLSNQSYSRIFTRTLAPTGSYTRYFVLDNWTGNYTRSFESSSFLGVLGQPSGEYGGFFTKNYTSGTTFANYVNAGLITYGAFTQSIPTYTVLIPYTIQVSESWSRNFASTWTNTFTAAFANFSRSFTTTLNWTTVYTNIYTTSYSADFTSNAVAYSRNFTTVGAWTNTFSQQYTNVFGATQFFSRLFTPNYNTSYTQTFSGSYTNAPEIVAYSGSYTNAPEFVAYVGNYINAPEFRAFSGSYTPTPDTFSITFTGSFTANINYTQGYGVAGYTSSLSWGGFTTDVTWSRQYQGSYSTTYSSPFTNTFAGNFNADYTVNWTGAYTRNPFTGTVFVLRYTGAFSGAFSGQYTEGFSGIYSLTFTGSYSNVFTGNYSGLTVLNITSSTTYTLWVRVA